MDRCLKVFKSVAIPSKNNTFLFVDIFLTEGHLNIVPYSAFVPSRSTSGRFTLAGTLMGGIGGLIVGNAIDSIKDSMFGAKAEDLESAEKKAKLQREKYFGRPVNARVEGQRGLKIPKERVTSVDYKDGWCRLTSSQEQTETVPLFGLDSKSLEIAETIKKWLSGSFPLSAKDGLEGANVGITINDFISSFEKMTNTSISSDTFKAIAEDSAYVKGLRDYIVTLKSVRRTQVLDWIARQARSLIDEMRVDLERDLQRQRKKFSLYFVVLIICIILTITLYKLGPVNKIVVMLMVISLITFFALFGWTILEVFFTLSLRGKLRAMKVRK